MSYALVMAQRIIDCFLVVFYQKLLDNYGRFIPNRFLQSSDISKLSFDFKLYTNIIDAYVYTLKRIEERGRLFAIKLQEQRLRKILTIANTTVWWKSYFLKNNISVKEIKDLVGFQQIPPVTRLNFLDVTQEDLLTCPITDPSIVWRKTSGSTTGTPLVWALNKGLMIVSVLSQFIKELDKRGLSFKSLRKKSFYMQFNYPHDYLQSEFKWFLVSDFVARSTNKDYYVRIQQMVKVMEDAGGVVIRTNPSELRFLIQELKAQNLHPPILFCLVVGQFLEEEVRLAAMEYLGCRVMAHYGGQEMSPLSIECVDHYGLYHVFSERAVIEILDNDCKNMPGGEMGNITVTCLDNTVMPLIRYQPGDVGVLHYDKSCTCGNAAPLLEVKSRDTDVLLFSDGNKVSVRGVLRRFNVEPFVSKVRRFQVRQDKFNEVKILLEIRDRIPREAIESLEQKIVQMYGKTLQIKIEQIERIGQDGPKFKVFVPLKLAPVVTE